MGAFASAWLAAALSAALATESAAGGCTRTAATSISGAPYALRGLDATALCAVHDPSLALENGTLYVFSSDTGRPPFPPFLAVRRSADGGATWSTHGAVFPALPGWVRRAVPAVGGLWAPDVSFLRGRWHLYYAASSFGSDDSAIGLATSPSLGAPAWEDRGQVLASSAAAPFNAIDPSLFVDAGGQPWLAFGSFWDGLHAVRIDAATGLVDAANSTVAHLAQRAPPDALEGAFLVARPDATYLFASWDFCCRGAASTYSVRVGRSLAGVGGPFIDAAGAPMLAGGGTPLLGGGHGWAAGGGQGFLRGVAGTNASVMVLHAYDAQSGDPFLQLVGVAWGADGWPRVEPDWR
jgi:arabinan endo-1,5-alpha-L-arabinosidase